MPQPLKYLIIVLSVAVIIALVVGALANEYARPANPGDGEITVFTNGNGDSPIDIDTTIQDEITILTWQYSADICFAILFSIPSFKNICGKFYIAIINRIR